MSENTIVKQVMDLEADMTNFMADAKKLQNKSAARRARKLSMEITKKLKEYRAVSLK